MSMLNALKKELTLLKNTMLSCKTLGMYADHEQNTRISTVRWAHG
jgi:hypothetical protein